MIIKKVHEMNNRQKRLLTVVGFVIAVGAVVSFSPLTASAQLTIPVIVQNTPAHPVPTRDNDRASRQPFYTRLEVPAFANPDAGSFSNTSTVPSGKRLIIEYVSASISVDPSQTVLLVSVIAGPVSTPSGAHVLTTTKQGTSGSQAHFIASAPVRLYVDPGVTVRCEAVRGDVLSITENSVGGPCFISGHFEDVP
jgi:hypothetical protein